MQFGKGRTCRAYKWPKQLPKQSFRGLESFRYGKYMEIWYFTRAIEKL